MGFSLGNLIILGIVLIVLALYRRMDVTNRTLEKVRKYAERAREDLDVVVLEKVQDLKDLGIELEVHQKAAREILRRSQGIEEDLQQNFSASEAVALRLQEYDRVLEDLIGMTRSAEENILRIKEESAFTDTVAKRIRELALRLEEQEARVPEVTAKFAELNEIALQSAQDRVMSSAAVRVEEMTDIVRDAAAKADELELFMMHREEENRRTAEKIHFDLEESGKGLKERITQELAQIEADYGARLEEAASRGETLETTALTKLKKFFEEKIKQVLRENASRLDQEKRDLEQKLAELAQVFRDARAETELELQGARTGNEARLEEERQNLERNLAELSASFQEARTAVEEELEGTRREAAARMAHEKAAGEEQLTRLITALREAQAEAERELETATLEISSRLEEERSGMELKLADLSTLVQGAREEVKGTLEELQRTNAGQLERERQELERTLEDLLAQVRDARAEAEQDLEILKTENALASEGFKSLVQEKIDGLEAGLYESESLMEGRIAESARKGDELVDSAFLKIREEIQSQALVLQNEAEERNSQFFESITERQAQLEGELAAIRQESETGEAEYQAALRRFQETESTLREKTDEILSQSQSLWTQASTSMDDLRQSLDRETQGMNEVVQAFIKENEDRLAHTGEDLQSRIVGAWETRLEDYEKNISYRFSRIDEVIEDVDKLEKNLRDLMEALSLQLREDFNQLGEDLRARRLADREQLERATQELRLEMDEMEQNLEDLKARAYDNVSEKLKVFEDDFFQDLRIRGEKMEEGLLGWQSQVDENLLNLERKSSEERTQLESHYTAELKRRFDDAQERFIHRMSVLDNQAEALEGGFAARTEESLKAFEEYRQSISLSLEEAKAASSEQIQEDLQRYAASLEEDALRFQKESQTRIKALSEDLEAGKEELTRDLDDLGSQLALGREKVLQDLRTSEGDINNRIAGFKLQISETVSSLRDEFSSQRDDLIMSTQEERTEMREELRFLGERIVSLQEELRMGTKESLESYRAQSEEARKEYLKKNMELQAEADGKIRDLRAIIADTRSQFETSNQKLYGQMEETATLLSINLGEIEKKQQNFVEQTKIFERADTLKEALGESIEELKAEMQGVDSRRQEMKDLEVQLQRIRKLGEEVSEKMSRFTVEKRRIDALESDYSRLINMSEAVELKLRQVSETDDGITAIQAALRGLESLQKDTEVRFDRLEKKKKILDVTAEGVDKNFALLGEVEKKLEIIQGEISQFPSNLATLDQRISLLAEGKEKADQAMEKLGQIDSFMDDLEKRMSQLQRIREWLAKTETRIEELTRDAQEQVKILGTLMKDESRGLKKERGAPSMSARETVTKLARQGWTVEQIAMATKLSRGEVELILELTAN